MRDEHVYCQFPSCEWSDKVDSYRDHAENALIEHIVAMHGMRQLAEYVVDAWRREDRLVFKVEMDDDAVERTVNREPRKTMTLPRKGSQSRQVLEILLERDTEGLSAREIAERLHVPVRSVSSSLENLLTKGCAANPSRGKWLPTVHAYRAMNAE